MFSLVVLVCSLVSFAFASPIGSVSRRGSPPTVVIANGTVIGTTLLAVESFKGIPYAQPPVGSLRLKPPQALTKSFGTFTSQAVPNACPQFWSAPDGGNLPEDVVGMITDSPVFQEIDVQSEDCLTVNVQRPQGTTSTSKLPVVAWIFGGAFAIGSASLYDGTRVIAQSVTVGQPIIYVAINYRLGGFGFLPGKEVSADGSSNLGLRDQRLALQWIQDNVAAFGGDPTKVTLWGESAGAMSSCDHTIINGGDISYKGGNLFRGAILNSGSTAPTVPINHPKAQKVYDTVASAGGCSSQADTLSCLRSLPYQQLRDAIASVPSFFSYSSIDLAYLPRPDPVDNFLPDSPDVLIQSGKFAKVPVIVGDQNDEGTLFSLTQSNISTTAQLVDYLTPFFPEATADVVAGMVATYPDSASAGSPFGTSIFNNIYPQFKRLAAILGDASFTLQRRSYLATISSQVPTWSYMANYLPLVPVLGTFHASDIFSTFYNVPPVLTTPSILTYYISFINNLDPNKISNSATWPQYNTNGKKLLQFGALSHSVISDTYRQSNYNYFQKNQAAFRL